MCGKCHSFSGHLFERLGKELGPWDGLTMTREFCEELVKQCGADINFPTYDGGSLSYCDKHVGDVDQYYAYPFKEGAGRVEFDVEKPRMWLLSFSFLSNYSQCCAARKPLPMIVPLRRVHAMAMAVRLRSVLNETNSSGQK